MRNAGVPVSAVVTALKQFFSELREPLIPVSLYDELKDAISESFTSCFSISYALLRPNEILPVFPEILEMT